MTQKNIWIVNQYAGSPRHGMEFRHYYLAKELVLRGHNVVIFSGSFSHLFTKQPSTSGLITSESIDGISYCWLKVPSYAKSTSLGRVLNMLVFAWRLIRLPLSQFAPPNAILVSSPSLFPILPARRWANHFKAKLLFEVRDIWPLSLEALSGLKPNHPLIWIMRKVERYAYRNADYVVSLLPNALDHFAANGMDVRKFIYIPNGIDLNEVVQASALPPQILELIPKKKFIVGYAGSIGASNALEYLIEAIKGLQNNAEIFFVIVGQGDQKVHLQEQCANFSNVLFLNPIPKNQIQSMLQLFDVCFISMHHSPLYRFGISLNKMFDYMYSGKPMLAALESPNNPAEQSGGAVIVKPENPEAIIRAILELKALGVSERTSMGEKGKVFVQAHHTYQSIADRYCTLIN